MHDDYLLVIGDVDEQLLPYLCFCTTGCSEAELAGHVARIAPPLIRRSEVATRSV